MEKLNVINEIEVYEFSCMGEELEYVLIEDTEENRNKLESIGMTDEDYQDMVSDDNTLEVSMFALDKCGAEGFQKEYGFLTMDQAKKLNLKWVVE